VILTLVNRGQREGVFDTPSAVVDSTIETIVVYFDVHPNEMASTKSVRFEAFTSADNGQTWQPRYAATSQGPWSGRPWFSFDPAEIHGLRVRARVTLSERMQCGVLLYVNEDPPD
jgi:hypothetical protein